MIKVGTMKQRMQKMITKILLWAPGLQQTVHLLALLAPLSCGQPTSAKAATRMDLIQMNAITVTARPVVILTSYLMGWTI